MLVMVGNGVEALFPLLSRVVDFDDCKPTSTALHSPFQDLRTVL